MAADLINTGIERPAIIRETDKAVCISVGTGQVAFGRNREVWLPKSKVTWEADNCFHETLRVPQWLARKL